MGVLDAGEQIRLFFSATYAEKTLDHIIHLSAILAENAPACRYRAAKVQNYILQYRSRPLEAVNDAFTLLGKPEPHFHSDIDCEDDLTSFHLSGSIDLFVFNSRIYSNWVNIVIFSRLRASNDEADNQSSILLQHLIARLDIRAVVRWTRGKRGRNLSRVVVRRNIGLHLSEITHPLPDKQRSREEGSERRRRNGCPSKSASLNPTSRNFRRTLGRCLAHHFMTEHCVELRGVCSRPESWGIHPAQPLENQNL